ncbi:MAG: hypothetical protein KDK36_03300 [Leptospiraceae bacterium]|nr:hypothetical protein [Leptospiraceae bacterium]
MMILRLASYLFFLIIFFEAISLTAVGWSFFESVNSSLSLIKYTSDNKARDILSTVARVAETKMTPEGQKEMNDFFTRLIKQSEKDLDKFLIKEIYLISNDGILLSHSNTKELKKPDDPKFNKPQHMRALRMRKGQLPTPQVIGSEYKGEDSIFGNFILEHFPDVKYNTILLSSPVYHTEKLEAIASIHLIYNRGNVLFFLDNQKVILEWMLKTYALIGFLISVLLWIIFVLYSFASYRQGVRVARSGGNQTVTSKTKNKITSIITKQEDTLQKYLTPIPARLDSDITLNIDAQEEENTKEVFESQSISFGDKKEEIKPSQNGNGKVTNFNNTQKKEKPVQNPTEAIDAIYLD